MATSSADVEALPENNVTFFPDPSYWLALGKFIEGFAYVEDILFSYFYMHAGIPLNVAKATFSGLHVDQLIAQTRRLMASETAGRYRISHYRARAVSIQSY
jgi:hypothetical protein